MVRPDHAAHKVSWLLTYPDAYEIGLPNQGLQILYEILNERDDAVAERAYAPWTDLEALMRRDGIPLFSVDNHLPAGAFDLLAFNLSAELTYTNLVNCIDLAGVPVRADQRGDEHPIVIAGGHCTYNPEPLADFLDAVVLGDGEEVVSEITVVVRDWKAGARGGDTRVGMLRELSKVPGVYVPSMYDVAYDGQSLVAITPRYPDVPERVEKRTIADLGDWPYPKNQLVPLSEVVHDRLNVEVFRGCTRGCRFCQAGMITRPVRERPADQVAAMVRDGLARTGYDEVALTSLSTADFSGIEQVVGATMSDPRNGGRVSVSLPSLRVDAFTVGIAAQIQRARRTGLTFAPEAGSWRLRQVINKLISDDDLFGAVESAYSQGWRRVKLYFLTGLPTETDEDTQAIAELGRRCVEIGREHPQRCVGHPVGGGFRAQAVHPLPVVRSEHGPRAEAQDRTAPRRPGPQPRGADEVARPRSDPRRGHRQSWRPAPRRGDRTGVAQRGHVPGVVRALRPRPVARRPWRPTGSIPTGTPIATAPRTRSSPGTMSPPVCTATSSGRTGATPSTRLVSRTAGGRHATTAAPATGYGIEHIVASARPPAGGSQGTGQGIASGGGVPVVLGTRDR